MDFDVVLNFAIVFATIYKVMELALHRKERLIMVDKFTPEMGKVDMSNFFGNSAKKSLMGYWPLRIGLLMMGCGLGFITALIIASQTDIITRLSDTMNYGVRGFYNTIITGCVFVFGGLGLLASYLIEARHEEKK